MKRFFSFNGTISGSSFILRTLFSILLSIPFLVLSFALFFSIFFNYMDIDFASVEGMSMAESNALGEKVGLKIAEDLIQLGAAEWFSQNVSILWITLIIISLVPFFWFTLATYYKRISAIFLSNRVKAFFTLIALGVTLDIIGLKYGNTIFWICQLIGLAIFGFLLLKNSPIGEHDG